MNVKIFENYFIITFDHVQHDDRIHEVGKKRNDKEEKSVVLSDNVSEKEAFISKRALESTLEKSRSMLVRFESQRKTFIPANNFRRTLAGKRLSYGRGFFANIGYSFDEIFPTGIVSHVGFSPLYATISFNTNFEISQVRLGFGSSIRMSEKIRLHLNASFGTLAKTLTVADTLGSHLVTLKSNLARVGLASEFLLTGRTRLQLGLQLNYLNTDYNSHSALIVGDVSRYQTISLPYTISNTFTYKTWIGCQVSVTHVITRQNR
ncbi:hypothetical protein WSM22_09550 [Cytophagales bacterium WSM2-2]|nr:hypothetical protein WSM22_09550 [Cytophagales bacterium WSM2-2]